MRILLLSAYDSDSHRYWRENLVARFPQFQWQQLTLPGRYFSWRIRGNPLSWYAGEAETLSQTYDLIVATSMVDLATLRGLFANLAATPALYYFHENQFAYPQSPHQSSLLEAQMVSLYGALSAQRLLFNSDYNRRSFCAGVAALLKKLPDRVPASLQQQLMSRSAVLPVPLVEPALTAEAEVAEAGELSAWAEQAWGQGGPIRLLWNARWEYDKGPDRLLALLRQLRRRDQDFRLCLLGQNFRQIPQSMSLIEREFSDKLVQFGYVESRQQYQHWLASADVVVSTAIHEFQGLAVLEAMAAGCVPLLPQRLAYPEYAPAQCLYTDYYRTEHEPGSPDYQHALEQEAAAAADCLQALMDGLERCPASRVGRVSAANARSYLWPQLKQAYEMELVNCAMPDQGRVREIQARQN